MKYQTIVVRGDQSTVAIVKANVPSYLANDTAFFAAIVSAVTEWVKDTENGKREWERSSKDFNIGDLSNVPGGSDLYRFMSMHEIENLDITLFDIERGNSAWTYDTLLVDEEELEKDSTPKAISPEFGLM